MKKNYILLLLLTLCSTTILKAQTITGHTVLYPANCNGLSLEVNTSYIASQQVETSWGDATMNTVNVYDTLGNGVAYFNHLYAYAGTYTIKHVLIQNSQRVDSVTYTYDDPHCETVEFYNYYDANNNCSYDALTDSYLDIPVTIKVDSANVPIDTIVVTSGFYYRLYGPTGTSYKFTPLDLQPGATVSCPAAGYISVTVAAANNVYTVSGFGFTCSGLSSFDLAENVSTRTGRHHASADILVTNYYCNSQNATLTVNFSPKYDYQSATPAPTTVNGNTLTWNLSNVMMLNSYDISVQFEVPAAWLTVGDTVHSSYYITPTAGDTDTVNNTVILVDTVISSYDPNYKDVTPKGNITAGTPLTYTIEFENTGNDTARNIYILDTLSDKVIPSSLNIVSSTARMNFSLIKDGSYNVAKFDFPNINLPDSANHKPCTGKVVYSIKTSPTLTPGTYIPNKAGIYFDDNEVVMTNSALNMIGIPQNVTLLGNNNNATIYPNPASDIIVVNTEGSTYNSLEVTNLMGQTLLTEKLTQHETKVNVKNLPAGIYTLTLKGDNGNKVFKFEKL